MAAKKAKTDKSPITPRKIWTVQQVEAKIKEKYGDHFPYEGSFRVTSSSTVECTICDVIVNLKGPGKLIITKLLFCLQTNNRSDTPP